MKVVVKIYRRRTRDTLASAGDAIKRLSDSLNPVRPLNRVV